MNLKSGERKMSVIITVAGSGTRFADERPKCLTKFMGLTLIRRTIRQIRKVDENIDIVVVTGYRAEEIEEEIAKIDDQNISISHNQDYEKDRNILSVYRGLEKVKGDALVLEGDCVYNLASLKTFIKEIGKNRNIIFGIGGVDLESRNAIISKNSESDLNGFIIGERPETMDTDSWANMSGAVIFSDRDAGRYLNWLEQTGRNPAETYYFQPLIEESPEFPCRVICLGDDCDFSTFNTVEQLQKVRRKMNLEDNDIQLIEINFLKHPEGFGENRVEWLREKIESEGVWTRPICIDEEHGIVMDGQHRMEVAKKIGLTHIPAILFSHLEVDFWSLRKNHEVTLESIVTKSLSGNPYPYKTVKYAFPREIPECRILLEEL